MTLRVWTTANRSVAGTLTEVQRRLADPLAGMEPAMAVLADVPKIIARGARSVLTLVAVMFGLFWMLGMLD